MGAFLPRGREDSNASNVIRRVRTAELLSNEEDATPLLKIFFLIFLGSTNNMKNRVLISGL